MRIYLSHPTAYDYQGELYEPLRPLSKTHTVVFPHETDKLFNSKKVIAGSDLIIAEVSIPSTGQGIEIGWADTYNVPILFVHKRDAKPSSSLTLISKDFIIYESIDDMIAQIQRFLAD